MRAKTTVSGDACRRVLPTRRQNPRLIGAVLLLLGAFLSGAFLLGPLATSCSAQVEKNAEAKDPNKPLLNSQRQISERYRRFEETLLRMAELNAATNPRRAALLRRVIAESRDRLLDSRFEELVDLLQDERYAKALESQDSLQRDLISLLTLLLSEDRVKRLAEEKARLRGYLKEIKRLVREQKNLRRRTERSENPEQLAKKQDRLADDTGTLKRNMKNSSGQSKPSQSKPGEGKSGKPGEGSGKEGKSGKGCKSCDGKGCKECQGKGKESEKKEPSQQGLHSTKSTQDRLEAAKKRMQNAREKLEKAKHKGAVKEQEEAIRELELAQADLEEILRQLREEEMERILMALEERIKRMLKLQKVVYKGTRRLDKVVPKKRTSRHEIDAGRLSSREALIVRQADQAMLLLREDGTVVAMPEALSQARDDMRQVTTRLARADVGKITLGTEEEIMVALEEMLAAIERELDNIEKRKTGQSKPGKMNQPLVDKLAELKMIRSMEVRIKRRTVRLDKLSTSPEVEQADLMSNHRELARRQGRIYEITRDIASGKTK